MMNNFFRFLSLMTLITVFIALFCGCGGKGSDGTAADVLGGGTSALSLSLSLESPSGQATRVSATSLDITSLLVQISSSTVSLSRTIAITTSSGSATISEIPAGEMTVSVTALSSSSQPRYSGSFTANFEAGQTLVQSLTLKYLFDTLEYFPIAKGNAWFYGSWYDLVSGATTFNGSSCYEIVNVNSDGNAELSDFFQVSTDGLRILGTINRVEGTMTTLSPAIFIPRYMYKGQTSISTVTFTTAPYSSTAYLTQALSSDSVSQKGTTSFSKQVQVTLSALESVTAGSGLYFSDTVVIDLSVDIDGDSPIRINLARGVGPVKEIEQESGSLITNLIQGYTINGVSAGTVSTIVPPVTPPVTPPVDTSGVLWVDAGAATGGNGASTAPFQTIEQAFAALPSTGGEIHVVSGTYSLSQPMSAAAWTAVIGSYPSAGASAPVSGTPSTLIDLSSLSIASVPSGSSPAGFTFSAGGQLCGLGLSNSQYFTGAVFYGGGVEVCSCSFAGLPMALDLYYSTGTVSPQSAFINDLSISNCGQGITVTNWADINVYRIKIDSGNIGVLVENATGTIANVITNNTSSAFHLIAVSSSLQIRNNLCVGASSGILLMNSAIPYIHSNIFLANNFVVTEYDATSDPYAFEYNLLIDGAVYVDEGSSSLTLSSDPASFTDINNSPYTNPDPYNNQVISSSLTALTSIFSNPSGGDYHLISGSPAVDSGNLSSTYNDASTLISGSGIRNDAGAYGGPQNVWP